MEMAQAEIEAMMRGVCGQPSGQLFISKEHLAKAVKTRKCEKAIGKDHRAAKLRAWIAEAVDEGKAVMLDPDGVEWMGATERRLAKIELRMLMEEDPEQKRALKIQLQRDGAMGAVMTWAQENEEPARGGWTRLRKEKRAQLRTARHRLWDQLGIGALDATILLLLLSAQLFPEVDPADQWVQDAATWVEFREWDSRTAAEMGQLAEVMLGTARSQHRNRDGSREWDLALDLGEGWGSIGIAASEIQVATIGVDRAGTLYQGTRHGHVRARVDMDFAARTGGNLLQKIVKKAGIRMDKVMMVWLSPECTLLSRANAINVSRGCAHGPYTEDPANLAAATPERVQEERLKFEECRRAVESQMKALEEEDVLFALENPMSSHFWEMEEVTSRVARMESKGWRIIRVDQCAYGRQARKETRILTNIRWSPTGLTGTGRCVIGQCSGTLGATPGSEGAKRHAQQTVPEDYSRRTRVGETPRGQRGEFSVLAAKNRVVPLLVQEIMQAARQMWQAPEPRSKRGKTTKQNGSGPEPNGEN